MGKMNKSGYSKDFRKTKNAGHHHTQKMIGNVTEGQGYADKRKRKILNTYKKMIHKTRTAESKLSGNQQVMTDTIDSSDGLPQETTHYTKNVNQQAHKQKNRYIKAKHKVGSQDGKATTVNRYTQAELQRQKLTKEHQEKLQEKKARRETREEALRQYREKKETRHKKLSKRTPKGQPIIKYQMEYLLQKIQSQTSKS
ncbi:thyroid transcription factor 1-associated protein 26-like [Patiria miniata]|uniref:Thyroid transcription factor 1-associated protein 26 n=1 Tax=Patiria miniata TaxID=46514 RepID=A0A913ZGB3_PATMI|nr:thyroid transcription factor 1-associated protein 26-like [Patiria miniata]